MAKKMRGVYQKIEEIDIHDDVEDGYAQEEENNNTKLLDVTEDNNMVGI